MEPTRAQREALAHIESRARRSRDQARLRIDEHLASAGVPSSALDRLVEGVRAARGSLHFHPDRPLSDGRTVVEHLIDDGRYRSQFETGISNGSRTAFPGGQRDLWEQALFGEAYRDAAPAERPRYGALNLLGHGDGASPRFGSCYFVLRPHVHAVASFTWGDSHAAPEHAGTLATFEPLLAALLDATARTGQALGRPGMTIGSLVSAILGLADPRASLGPVGRALDDYVEMQIHTGIELSSDAEALVIDPAFTGTAIGDHLRALADRCGLLLRAHAGFVIAPDAFPEAFRGPEVVRFAARVEERFARVRGEIDAFVLGQVAASLHEDPASWQDWAPPDETLQHLKQLWHVLVAHGRLRTATR